MFGSPTLAGYLMKHGLIDVYWLMINPIILGEGISLFRNVSNEINLILIESVPFSGGVMGAHYVKG